MRSGNIFRSPRDVNARFKTAFLGAWSVQDEACDGAAGISK